jgi:IS30 family transposase
LTLADREEISRGLAAGESIRGISARIGRAPSTVSREGRSYSVITVSQQQAAFDVVEDDIRDEVARKSLAQ